MKLYRIIIMLGLTGTLLSGCSDEATLSAEEKLLNNLSGTWEITSVTMNDTDVTADYSSFELTLSGSASSEVFAYGVVERPDLSPWPAGGTWSFGDEMKAEIVRDPGTDDVLFMSYTVTESQLTIEFMFNGMGYDASRVNSAEGSWVYTFVKN